MIHYLNYVSTTNFQLCNMPTKASLSDGLQAMTSNSKSPQEHFYILFLAHLEQVLDLHTIRLGYCLYDVFTL